MTATADRVIMTPATPQPLVSSEDVPTPCACGGVLAFVVELRAYVHLDLCLTCATGGYVQCGPDCGSPLKCSVPAPLTCATCGSDLTVDGCTVCADPELGPDPDHAYDLARERHW